MRLLAGALAALLLAATAAAETAVAESIEWMVADSDLVVRARFLRREPVEGHPAVEGRPAGFSVSSYRVLETLRGEQHKQLRALARDLEDGEAGVEGAEYLLLLVKHCRRFTEPGLHAIADNTPYELRGWIRLDAPIQQYTMACNVITKRATLLDTVRRAARHELATVVRPVSHRLDVPTDSPCYYHLYGGSAVYMVVPVDGRLVRLARIWLLAEGPAARLRSAGEILPAVEARVRALERIAGSPVHEAKDSGSLLKRLARAEAGVVALRDKIHRARETSRDGGLRKALLGMRLARLSRGPEDRAAVIEVFRHDFDTLAAAARETLWPIVLDERKEGTDRVMDLCERTDGRVALNVLRLRAWGTGVLQYVAIVEERLYCFRDDRRAFYIDVLAYSRAGLLRDTIQGRVQLKKRRGAAHTVPANMELERLVLSPANIRHWMLGLPMDWRGHAPKWAAPFLFDEFRHAFRPETSNRKGETDPGRR